MNGVNKTSCCRAGSVCAYNGIGWLAVAVVGVLLPIVEIDFPKSTNHQLELLGVDDVEEGRRYNVVKATLECDNL